MHSRTLLFTTAAALLSLTSATWKDNEKQFPACGRINCIHYVSPWSTCQEPFNTDPLCPCKDRFTVAATANCWASTCKVYGDPDPAGDVKKAHDLVAKLCKADGITIDEEAWKTGAAWDPLAPENKGLNFPYWEESNAMLDSVTGEPIPEPSFGAAGTSTGTAGAASASSSSGAGAVEVGLGMGALVMAAMGAVL